MTQSAHPLHRLYIVTGKGGVGKTSLAMSLVAHLRSHSIDAHYNCFLHSPNTSLLQELSIPCFNFGPLESAQVYIGKKLNSEFAAKWIIKTPFFKALFNMVPGLAHLIALGHILDILEKNPEMVLVVDSPSSGHVRTLFESGNNFREMFGHGKIVEDINKMESLIGSPHFLKTIILGLPFGMAIQEGRELIEYLNNLGINSVDLVINQSMQEAIGPDQLTTKDLENAPNYLTNKLKLENQELEKVKELINDQLPLINKVKQKEVILDLISYFEKHPPRFL